MGVRWWVGALGGWQGVQEVLELGQEGQPVSKLVQGGVNKGVGWLGLVGVDAMREKGGA